MGIYLPCCPFFTSGPHFMSNTVVSTELLASQLDNPGWVVIEEIDPPDWFVGGKPGERKER